LQNPCIGCKKFWYVGRGCSCGDFCNDLKLFRLNKQVKQNPNAIYTTPSVDNEE